MEQLTIIIEGDGIKHLHHDLEASHEREEMFKQKMMKAQSQADTMRRFIEDQEYQAQFAGFVLIARKHARRCDIYAEFGFNQPEPEAIFDPSDLPDWARADKQVVRLCIRDKPFRARVFNVTGDEARQALIDEARSILAHNPDLHV